MCLNGIWRLAHSPQSRPLADPAELGTWSNPPDTPGCSLHLTLCSGSLAPQGTSGFMRNSNNKQGATLYFPEPFILGAQSSLQTNTHRSPAQVPGPWWG